MTKKNTYSVLIQISYINFKGFNSNQKSIIDGLDDKHENTRKLFKYKHLVQLLQIQWNPLNVIPDTGIIRLM